MQSGIDIERGRQYTEAAHGEVPARPFGPAVTILTCVVFGVFCLIATSTMGGTAEYLKGVRFAIGFGMFGVFFAVTVVQAILTTWQRRRSAMRTR